MGRRGPAPEPIAFKRLRGETRPSRINRAAPAPVQRLPKVPSGMSEPAQKVWKRVMREFAHTGVLTAVDTDVFRAYCESVVRYEHAAQLLEQSGPLVRGARNGELVKNPLHQIVRDNADLMRALARELGFTPAARTGLHVSEDPREDPLDAFLRGAG
jgi:P27 family predicted phage terminase small subunit